MRHAVALLVVVAGAAVGGASAEPPEYMIVNLGVAQPGDFGSQAFRVSDSGIATGRSLGSPTPAFRWMQGEATEFLPNLASPARAFSAGNGVNDSGVVVGTGSTTSFGSSPLPLIWTGSTVAALPLPAGEAAGRANNINNAGVAVGSVDGGSAEEAAVYFTQQAVPSAMKITTTTAGGARMTTAFSINNAGLIVGNGVDPLNAARNVGLVYNLAENSMIDIGGLPGRNGALCFDVSNAGHVVGSSQLNQGSGLPFIWTSGSGMAAVPLPAGTSSGIARGVNSDGWVVGIASSAFAVPFLYDGTQTYTIQELLPANSGWDVSTNTSSSALGISEDGIIVGTGIFNGLTRAYAMIPLGPKGCNAADVSEAFGTLDINDVLVFAAAFNAMDEAADFFADGMFDINDVLVFAGAFNEGCP